MTASQPAAGAPAGATTVVDTFADGLDPGRWLPAYLPAWSSVRGARAEWSATPEGLRLSIPTSHPLWCADRHTPPLRVSAVQSGNRSGLVGSTDGQQPFAPGLIVREEQPTLRGLLPHFGQVEVECRARIGPAAMFSAWLVGWEDIAERSGEICLVEVFGDSVRAEAGPSGPSGPGMSAAVGRGIHRFRDPTLTEDFAAPRRGIDVSCWHRYAVDWRPGRVRFEIDGTVVTEVDQAPDYPMQLILGVFDFPDHPAWSPSPEPELVVREVRMTSPGAG